MSQRILEGDCLAVLPTLPAGNYHCVVTSPPYLGLRLYGGTATWHGGDLDCDHQKPKPARRRVTVAAASDRQGVMAL